MNGESDISIQFKTLRCLKLLKKRNIFDRESLSSRFIPTSEREVRVVLILGFESKVIIAEPLILELLEISKHSKREGLVRDLSRKTALVNCFALMERLLHLPADSLR
jgi:hypothetical protein